jgi:CRISPR-associated endonuclease Csn1
MAQQARRLRQGAFSRSLERRTGLLFRRQRELGNPHAGTELETAILGGGDRKSGLFWEQKPPLAGADLLKMLGKCTFERDEYRAPKASFTAERHVWLTRLNNLRIVVDGTTRPLNEAERCIALPLPYKQAGDFTYKQLRAALTKAGLVPEILQIRRPCLSDRRNRTTPSQGPRSGKAGEAPCLAGTAQDAQGQGTRNRMGRHGRRRDGRRPERCSTRLPEVLSVFKDGDEVTTELRKLPLPGGRSR